VLPPLVGVAVKVIEVPTQTLFLFEEIETEGVTLLPIVNHPVDVLPDPLQ
jgi:hypothetical protein